VSHDVTTAIDHLDMDEGGGHHGWDDTGSQAKGYSEGGQPDMRAIFFANGPSFKAGHINPWIKLIDEYQVFVHVLGIEGEEHQGDFDRVADMFREEEDEGGKSRAAMVSRSHAANCAFALFINKFVYSLA